MLNFIKASFREIKHVVWPTKEETRKYFLVVVSVLVLFGLYLFLFSNMFSYVIFFLKDNLGNIL
ncbi:MAG: preprotein translocase subunit SecE [Candidatus Gracilibacteria bacterium]|nr:preprotein translocase subunit SecE [Candidatus Gracilibacteria bacterium]